MRTNNELSQDELSNQELANVSGGESITFVYGKLAVQYFAQSADGKASD
jgi:bacteriocin-like protein